MSTAFPWVLPHFTNLYIRNNDLNNTRWIAIRLFYVKFDQKYSFIKKITFIKTSREAVRILIVSLPGSSRLSRSLLRLSSFPSVLAPSNCLKTAKLSRLAIAGFVSGPTGLLTNFEIFFRACSDDGFTW